MILIQFQQIPAPGVNNPTYVCQTPTGVLVLVFGQGAPALAHVPGVRVVFGAGRAGLQSMVLDLGKADCAVISKVRVPGRCCLCQTDEDNPIACSAAGAGKTHCEHWFQSPDEKGEDVK